MRWIHQEWFSIGWTFTFTNAILLSTSAFLHLLMLKFTFAFWLGMSYCLSFWPSRSPSSTINIRQYDIYFVAMSTKNDLWQFLIHTDACWLFLTFTDTYWHLMIPKWLNYIWKIVEKIGYMTFHNFNFMNSILSENWTLLQKCLIFTWIYRDNFCSSLY